MNLPLINDRRTSGRLKRVRKDIHQLREDIGDLLHHATSTSVPNGARELANQAKSHLTSGRACAVSRMRKLRHQAPDMDHTPAWVGGAVIVGLLAFGVYALCRNGCQSAADRREAIIPPDDYPEI
jgi:hypothetical protein